MANMKRRASRAPATTGDRYLFRFDVTGSRGVNYRISFDTARGCWICSCPGCISHQKTCKHLRACDLTGPEELNQSLPTSHKVAQAKRLGGG